MGFTFPACAWARPARTLDGRPVAVSASARPFGLCGPMVGSTRPNGVTVHEMAITQSVVDAVCEHAAGRQVHSVERGDRRVVRGRARCHAVLFRARRRGDGRRGSAPGHRTCVPGAARCRTCGAELRHCGPDLVVPLWQCRRRSPRRAGPANPVDGSELNHVCNLWMRRRRRQPSHCPRHSHPTRSHRSPRTRHTTERITAMSDARPHRDDYRWNSRCLAKNDLLAEQNREVAGRTRHRGLQHHQFAGRGQDDAARAHHPRTGRARPVAVIEGDQETLLDAERIRATGRACVQINTGAGCHLDAEMVRRALSRRSIPSPGTLLFIENVGNLVCPALFDLGERSKVVVISVTEGDRQAVEVSAYVRRGRAGDRSTRSTCCPTSISNLNSCAAIRALGESRRRGHLPMSATTGDGVDRWYEWIVVHADVG